MYHYEFSFIRKDGVKRTGELRVAVYPDLSGKMNSLIQVIDITERKRITDTLRNAEELYRNIFLNAQTGLFRTDIKSGMLLMLMTAWSGLSVLKTAMSCCRNRSILRKDTSTSRIVKE